MENYDIDIMKSNILNIMSNQNITQTKLSEDTGIPQPTISDVLSRKNSHCFTIVQLVSIANALHISTDELLGISSSQNISKEICLSDICQKLFELDEVQNISIGICQTDGYDTVDEGVFGERRVPINTECIYFKNNQISRILKEWREVKSPGSLSKQLRQKMIQLWKDDTLNKNKTRMKRWKFRNEEEQGMHLANILLDHYREPFSSGFTPLELHENDNQDVLRKFMNESAISRLGYEEYHELNKAVKQYIGAADEELPF